MKKMIAGVLCAAFLGSPVYAAEGGAKTVETTVTMNGYAMKLPHKLLNENGVILIAATDFVKPLFGNVAVAAGGKTASVTKSSHTSTMVFTDNSTRAAVDGAEKTMPAAARILDGQLYMPLRFYCENLGFEVEYSAEADDIAVWTYDKDVLLAIEKVNEYCKSEDTLNWVIGQYDPDQGGFYYATSSRDYPQFGINIESTRQGLDFLETGKIQGLYRDFADAVPQKMKDEMAGYVYNNQSDEDGYFYNPWQGKVNQVKKERDLSRAVSILNVCGVKPKYKLPAERLREAMSGNTSGVSSPAYDWLLSEDAFRARLDSLNWNDPYSAGNYVASAGATIIAAGMQHIATDFIARMQNPETGLWGDGYTYDAIDGAMKIGAFFASAKTPYPSMDKAIASVVKTITGADSPETICEVWNGLVLVEYILSSNGYKVSAETRATLESALIEIIDTTYENMQKFKHGDGGISFYMDHGQASTHGSAAGLGLAEGDMDATYIGTLQIRRSLYALCHNSFVPPMLEDRAEEIWARLENAPPVKKLDIPEGLSEDFEGAEIGPSLPSGVSKVTNVGSVEIAEDPLDPANKALRLTTASGGLTQIGFSPYFSAAVTDVVFECDLMVSSLTSGSSFYNRIGAPAGLQWCVSSADGKSWNYSWRTNETGVGGVISGGLAFNRWYKIKIRYQPDGPMGTVTTYFLDGKIVDRTGRYYNANDAAAIPDAKLDTVNINSFTAATGTLYFDNIHIYKNN